MKIYLKIVAIILTLSLSSFFNATMANSYEAKRTVTKSFEAYRDHTLSIKNRYGNLNIQTWNKNEIYFEIKIVINASTQKKADEILSKIDLILQQEGKTVSAQTIFERDFQCNNCGITIDYQVAVPKGINYIIDQKYGQVGAYHVEGNTNITVQYGNLTIGGNLTGSKNNINVKYGNFEGGNFIDNRSNNIDVKYGNILIDKLTGNINKVNASYAGKVNIKQTNKLDIDIKYSKLNIGNADELNIGSGYTNTSIDKVRKMNIISKHENYTIGEIDELKAQFAYTNVSIEKLNKTLAIREIRYGKLDIDYVSPNFELIKVDSKYTGITITFDPKASYNIDLYVKYATINVPSNSKVSRSEPERNSIQVKGKVGNNPSPKSNVTITSGYNNINLQ